jgi:hypothetical protein
MSAPIYNGGAPFIGTYFRYGGARTGALVAMPLLAATTPVDGTSGTGAGFAGKGSVAIALDTGAHYYNTGTKASPTWTAFGSTAGAATPSSVVSSGLITSTSPSAGIGYATGAGGAVTQITSRTTGVTLSKVSGTIQTDTSSLAAEASANFTVTNTAVAIGDVVILAIQSGTNGGNTAVSVVTVAAGSFVIKVSNNNAAAGTAETGAIIINFAVIKAVAA